MANDQKSQWKWYIISYYRYAFLKKIAPLPSHKSFQPQKDEKPEKEKGKIEVWKRKKKKNEGIGRNTADADRQRHS